MNLKRKHSNYLQAFDSDLVKFRPISGADFANDDDDEMLDDNRDENKDDSRFGKETEKHTQQRRNVMKNDSATPSIDKYGKDISKAALEGKLDPVIGREQEIERLAQILSRRKKNNPVLIGAPGVGKSAIIEGLALRIIQRKVARVGFD